MLPRIPYRMAKNKRQVVAMRGINYSNLLTDGDIADSKNISARAYPYITTRKSRTEVGDYSEVTALTVFQDKFVVVKGTDLICDGVVVGQVTRGEKQFAVINTKLVIMPDKVYLDGETMTLCPMGAEIFSRDSVFGKDFVTLANTSYMVASGRGSFSGNTFTSGKTLIWTRDAEFTADGKLLLYTTRQCSVVDVNTVLIQSFPADLIDKVNGQELSLTTLAYDEFYTGVGRVKSSWMENGNLYVRITGTIYPSVADAQRCKIVFRNIYSAGDSLTFTVDKETRVRAVATSGDTVLTTNPTQSISAYRSEISIEAFPDLTTLFEVGWSVSFSGNASGNITSVTHNTITIDDTFTTAESFTTITREGSGVDVFKVGDAVTIDNSKGNDITFVINRIEGNTLCAENEIFTEGTDSGVITVSRRIPDLDFICSSNNRIWGCSSKDHSIYASALGDPTNFFDYSGESTDSYAVTVGSSEDFTGCIGYDNGVFFFKENKIHKVLGSYPAGYVVYDYDLEGVQRGCHKSMQIINEVLYYKGRHGIYAFSGAPSLISSNFGERDFYDAVAGNDGDTYYISMRDGEKYYLFAYELRYGMWVLEGNERAIDFVRKNGDMYMLFEGGKFCLCGAGDSETGIDWHVQFTPLYETIEGQKSYSRIVFRLELPRGSHIAIDVKTDGGAWREVGKVVGRVEGIVPVPVPINRCDRFEIRIRGKGKCTIHQMVREFFVGGDK